MNVKLKVTKTFKEKIEAIKVRSKVFVLGQKVDPYLELEDEENSIGAIAIINNNVIAAGRFRKVHQDIKLERIAVLPEYRGKGIGSKLTKFIIKKAKETKHKKIYLNSQYYVCNFYEKLGFRKVGRPFYQAKIKHIKMVLG